MSYKILWTDEAVNNLEQILHYISTEWTDKEVANFKKRLVEQLNIISKFPSVFPASATVPRLRRAVLSKQTTIFYEVRGESIYIVYLFDNRQNPDKLTKE